TNLGLEVKAFHQRFDALEKRTRFATLGVHVLVALVIGLAAFAVTRAQSAALLGTIEALEAQTAEAQRNAAEKSEELRTRVAKIEQDKRNQAEARALATKIVDTLGEGRESDAVADLEKLDSSTLTSLEQRLIQERTADAKRRAGEAAYRSGKRYLEAGRDESAIRELARAVKLDPEGRFSDQSRYLLVTAMWRRGRFDELASHLDALAKTQKDRNLLDELNFIRATSMAHSGQKAESRVIMERLTRSRWGASAKAYLAAIEAGGDLPPIPGAK
ncbi:MAG: hypothetical protein AAF658_20970, partial [Myxococcota bacterium]